MRIRRLCERCQERWPQLKDGLCRRCSRELGDIRTFDRVREKVAQRRPPQAMEYASPPPPVHRTCTIEGEDFDVIWGGVGPLPGSGDAHGLGSTLSTQAFKVYLP